MIINDWSVNKKGELFLGKVFNLINDGNNS